MKTRDITTFEFTTQKRAPNVSSTAKDLSSYCACAKQTERQCVGAIEKGEQIIKVRWSFLTVEDKRWYHNDRWRPKCFYYWLLTQQGDHLVHMDLEATRAKHKKAETEALKYVNLRDKFPSMDDQQFDMYKKLRARYFAHKARLNKYQTRFEPTDQTIQAARHQELILQELAQRITEMEEQANHTAALDAIEKSVEEFRITNRES